MAGLREPYSASKKAVQLVLQTVDHSAHLLVHRWVEL